MKNTWKFGWIFLLLPLTLASCSLFKPILSVGEKPLDERAEKLLCRLQNRNSAITSSRGSGRIQLQHGGRKFSARLVWAARLPDKLRIELLGPFGTGLGRLATDGERMFIYSPEDNRMHRTSFSDAGLARLIYLPIQIRELTSILTGGIPLRYQRIARWGGIDAMGNQRLLISNMPWGGRQEVFFDSDAKRIKRIDIYQFRNRLVYGAKFDEQGVNGVPQIPKGWTLYDNANTTLSFSIDRCDINIALDENIFRLDG